MIAEEDFNAASDPSPEMAFVRLERKFRASYEKNLEGNGDGSGWDHFTIEYMNHVVAAAKALEIGIFKDWSLPSRNNNGVYNAYNDFRAELDHYTVQIQIAQIRSGPRHSVALDESEKKHLRAYADKIKEIIGHSSIPVAKKERLYDKLNAFIVEVDRDRTPLQRFTDVIMALSTTGGEAAEELEPTWKWVRLAAEVLGVRQETEQSKLPPSPKKKLEPPRRQLPAPKQKADFGSLDDEIPF